MTANAGEENEDLDGGNESLEENVISSENDDTDNNQSEKNSSNWKKMSETKKALERDLRLEREEKSALKADLAKLQEWANSLYEDDSQKPFSKKEEAVISDKADLLEKKIFLMENREAKEHMELVDAARSKYKMDFDDAWDFVKAKLPKESISKTSFDTKGKTSVAKDYTKVSFEDSASLSPVERREWRKANGWA